MAIQSLGVGSGLALDDLVKQLLESERKPKYDRLDQREERLEAVISGLGALKSKMDDFKDTVNALRKENQLGQRSATAYHPGGSSSEDEDGPNTGAFSAEASNSAVTGSYKIAITQLASGSRLETASAASGGFTSSSDVVSNTAGSMTFKVGSDSFDINVTAGMTLQQLRNAVNDASENFGVTASIINTGTADGGAKLVFTSEKTGAGNDLVIVNNDDIADLQRVSTTDSSETATYLAPAAGNEAKNAKATIDGIEVESSTNKFENVIENVSFDAKALSSKDANGVFEESTLKIGFDSDGVEKLVRDFVDNYNALMDEMKNLTKYGASELEEDGPLAGDFMARDIRTGLANIVASSVPGSELGSLFQLGVSFDRDGKLQITANDEYGIGSGEDLLKDALSDRFDEVGKLFTDADSGIATRIYDYLHEYTTFGGLLRSREDSYKDQREEIYTERERLDLQMMDFEQNLRKKYLGLDMTVARLNQTRNAMIASLSSMGG